MISSSTSRRASSWDLIRTTSETLLEFAAQLNKRHHSSDSYAQTDRARVGAVAGVIIISFLIVVLAAPSANADSSGHAPVGPEEADLRHYFDCSKVATMRPLSLDEATSCSRVFMRIKLAFVQGSGLDDFDRLPTRERAAVNLIGYKRYMDWRSESSDALEALTTTPLSLMDFAGPNFLSTRSP